MYRVSSLVVASLLVLGTWGATQAQQSCLLTAGVPTSARVNTNIVLSARLSDMYNAGVGLAGVPVAISIGDRYSLSTTTFYTANNGVVQRTWRFTSPGVYRVTFKFNGGWGFLDDRITVLINITP